MTRNALLALACAAGLVSLTGLTAEAAAKKPAYIGTWGLDAASCRAGETDMVITRKEWGMTDSECRIRSITGGKGVWRANLYKCKGEGANPTERVTIWATATRATTKFAGTNFRNNWVRCR